MITVKRTRGKKSFVMIFVVVGEKQTTGILSSSGEVVEVPLKTECESDASHLNSIGFSQ